jgi:hypothetical protein
MSVVTNNVQLGSSVTATQNFTITAEAADGTMKLARGNAGATTQDIFTVDASGNVTFIGNVTGAGLGSGQTWQDVTVSRAIGTTYTNSTGKPILVSVNGVSGATATLTVAGVQVARCSQSTGGLGWQLSAVVPADATYVYNTSAGNLANWAELR